MSLPALTGSGFDGRDLRLGQVLAVNDAFTKYAVTYRGSDLAISGVLYVPAGAGPFPGVVLNHGYIDPAAYVTGQGLQIEQDYLARSGFVVLHTDYRNHAGSDRDPENDVRLRLGYTQDTINAVLALRRSGLPELDPERIGMMGRSMGGGVTLNALVVQPDIVDAAVIYASVSSNTVDNHQKWTRGQRPDLAAEIAAVDEADYMQCNPLFNRLIAGGELNDGLRRMLEGFRFGTTVRLRHPGLEGARHSFQPPPEESAE